MEENKYDLQLAQVDDILHEPLQALFSHLQEHLRQRLQSIIVVGSCLTSDYHPKVSDINTVLMVDRLDIKVLDALGAMIRPLAKRHHLAVPLLMTQDYIKQSRDVFGIEFLDFQLTHCTILGQDPFAELTFKKSEVRLQCERELKADLIRLRQGYITAGTKDILIRDVLIAGVKSLVPLLRALLWLQDQPRDPCMSATFTQASESLSITSDMLIKVANWRWQKTYPKGPDLRRAFDQVYNNINTLANVVDTLEV